MKFIVSCILIVLSNLCFSQSDAFQEAKTNQDRGYYHEAIKEYKNILGHKKTSPDLGQEVKKELGWCYYNVNNYAKADFYWTDYLTQKPEDKTLYKAYGIAANVMGNQTLQVFYKKYVKPLNNTELDAIYNKDQNALNELLTSNYVLDGVKLNTLGLSMGVTEWKDGYIVGKPSSFSSEDKTIFYNLSYIKSIDSTSTPEDTEVLKDFSNKFYSGFPSWHAGSSTLYYTTNSSEDDFIKRRKIKKTKKNQTVNKLIIASRVYTEGNWQESKVLDLNNLEYNFTHPCISKDGRTLYFVSDMPGGFGGYDIYKAEWNNGAWSTPQNLGKNVNSSLDEMTPFVRDGILFFSSKGHSGFGGYDVFKVNLNDLDKRFQEAVNLGEPINSAFDDFAFYINEKGLDGFVSTNRASENGEDALCHITIAPFKVIDAVTNKPIEFATIHIAENGVENMNETDSKGEWTNFFGDSKDYVVTVDDPYYEIFELKSSDNNFHKDVRNIQLKRVTLNGHIIDAITEAPIVGAEIVLFEKDEDGNWKEIETMLSGVEGEWSFNIRRDKEYKVQVDKEDFMVSSETIPSVDSNNPERENIVLKLDRLKLEIEPVKNTVVNIDNIYFDFGKYSVRAESFPILDNLVRYLHNNPEVRIELSAHTDCISSDQYNLVLSRKRARTIYNYLVAHGISKRRLVSKGYGERRPLNSCDEQMREPDIAAKNRRVEVKIL